MQLPLLFVAFVLVVVNARTILWTNAGGNPLWNNAGNWDCMCLPTINDDVVIDIQAIPGNVQIGGVVAPALANSLTIGGTSRWTQTLTINGPLTIGGGGSKLSSNGRIYFQAGSNAPFINGGVFSVEGSGFAYSSGTLSGSGSFVFSSTANLNLTGAASKVIATTVIVNGKASTETATSTNIEIAKTGNFIVAGTFNAYRSLSVEVDDGGAFSVKGNLAFSGASLSFQGSGIVISSWSVGTGDVTIDNSITSGTLSIGGGSLSLIGGPHDVRSFTTITGTGTIQNYGGVNSFTSIQASTFNAVGGNATIASGSIGTLNLKGAFLLGGKIQATNAALNSGFLCGGLVLTPNNLVLDGVVSIVGDGTSLSLQNSGSNPGSGTVTRNSLLTMSGGSSFKISTGSVLRLTAPLGLVPGPAAQSSPFVNINGQVTSYSTLSVSNIPITGAGSYILNNGASWVLNNVNFNASSVSNSGTISLSVGNFLAGSISGTGSISGNPSDFYATTFSGNSFTLNTGFATVGNATLSTLNLNNGASFNVVNSAKLGALNFIGGKLAGTASGSVKVPISVGNTTITGAATQTLSNVAITTNSLTLDCGLQASCQFFSRNSYIKTA